MSFSVSSSAPFSSINWKNFENRPEIKDSMPFCTENNWNKKAKCCSDGYSIEHALDMIPEEKMSTPEAKFLEKYPCVNGIELESLVNKISEENTTSIEPKHPKPVVGNGDACDERAVKAFLKFVKSIDQEGNREIQWLKEGMKISCQKLIEMTVRYAR